MQGVGNGPKNGLAGGFARVTWVFAGRGSHFSEASMSGFESTALELVVAPECPPGPVFVDRIASARNCR